MNLFKFDKGATIVERIVTIGAAVLFCVLVLFLYGSVWGIFTNNLSRAAATGNGWDHTLGTILLLVNLAWVWLNATDRIPFKVNDALIGVVAAVVLVLSICAYCGFGGGVY